MAATRAAAASIGAFASPEGGSAAERPRLRLSGITRDRFDTIDAIICAAYCAALPHRRAMKLRLRINGYGT